MDSSAAVSRAIARELEFGFLIKLFIMILPFFFYFLFFVGVGVLDHPRPRRLVP
jgi:hypothetical protein